MTSPTSPGIAPGDFVEPAYGVRSLGDLVPAVAQALGAGEAFADARPSATDASESPTATTVSLDDLVDRRGLRRVDFVKMDIEGAEPAALAGGAETIARHRPRLALAVYHDVAHPWQLADALEEIAPGYRLALGHFTMHLEETVLYAWPGDEP